MHANDTKNGMLYLSIRIVETVAAACCYGTLVPANPNYMASSCRTACNYHFLLLDIKLYSSWPL